jgi:hypothetical protein
MSGNTTGSSDNSGALIGAVGAVVAAVAAALIGLASCGGSQSSPDINTCTASDGSTTVCNSGGNVTVGQ